MDSDALVHETSGRSAPIILRDCKATLRALSAAREHLFTAYTLCEPSQRAVLVQALEELDYADEAARRLTSDAQGLLRRNCEASARLVELSLKSCENAPMLECLNTAAREIAVASLIASKRWQRGNDG